MAIVFVELENSGFVVYASFSIVRIDRLNVCTVFKIDPLALPVQFSEL